MQFEENKARLPFPSPLWERVARIVRCETGEGSGLSLCCYPSSAFAPRRHLLPQGEKGKEKGPGRNRGLNCITTERQNLLVAVLERGAENIAQRRSRIGGAVLRDGFLFFRDFERLDRDLHLAGLLVELDHPRIDLLTDGEPLGALIVAIAGELGALDEGGEVGTDDLHVD